MRLSFAGWVLLLAASPAVSPRTARADLVSHWSFDGTLADQGPGGNDGAFFGADAPEFVTGVDGRASGAIRLNGIDEYVVVEQRSGLPVYGNPEFTIALWVRGGPQGDRRFFAESSSESFNALFNLGTQNLGTSGQVDLFVRDDAGGVAAHHMLSNGAAFDADWHHIVWVDRGGSARLYIDGALDGRAFEYGRPDLAAGDPTVSIDTTTIGGILRESACCWFGGDLDDMKIWDHALDADEVREVFLGDRACPSVGDTRCTGVVVDAPEGSVYGTYGFEVSPPQDASGDGEFLYTFRATGPQARELHAGPQASPRASFLLSPGAWSVEVTVDDDPLCIDQSPDATCVVDVEVLKPAEQLIGEWVLDGDLEDLSGNDNHGSFLVAGTQFATGYDGTVSGAVRFDGVDDLIVVEPRTGLPLYSSDAFTIAMWVRGEPQPDMRVWSEGSTKSPTPLFNIGTEQTGRTGQVDVFIRGSDGVAINHRVSLREAFDGGWHHIAWVDDRGSAVLYIDGVADRTDFSYVRPQLELDTTTIGGILRAGPSHFFNGDIDDVRVYNYAASAAEIEDLAGVIACPGLGDTHCDDILVEAPAGGLAGDWRFVALDATDDSGDPIIYNWTATGPGGVRLEVGPTDSNSVVFELDPGAWSIGVTVDDNRSCDDIAADARCSVSVVVARGADVPFFRGDGNADGLFNLTDAIGVLNFLFLGASAPRCEDGADADDSGTLNLTDGVFMLTFLFQGTQPPRAPFPGCGDDPTEDGLGCAESTCDD